MTDIIERLRIESRREPHEPIWRDAIDEIEALRELEEREQHDEALLRQALEALELRCGTHADERKELIPALRKRLGEGAALKQEEGQ